MAIFVIGEELIERFCASDRSVCSPIFSIGGLGGIQVLSHRFTSNDSDERHGVHVDLEDSRRHLLEEPDHDIRIMLKI